MTDRIAVHDFPGNPISGFGDCKHCRCPYVKREVISCHHREPDAPAPIVRESIMFADLSGRIAEIRRERDAAIAGLPEPDTKPPSWANLIDAYQAAHQ